MRAYGCWDCGTETLPYQGRCPVCGWPAPATRLAPRRRRRVLPILVIVALCTCAMTYFFARIGHRHLSHAPRAMAGKCVKHQLTYHETNEERVFVCEDCGLKYRIDNGSSTFRDR